MVSCRPSVLKDWTIVTTTTHKIMTMITLIMIMTIKVGKIVVFMLFPCCWDLGCCTLVAIIGLQDCIKTLHCIFTLLLLMDYKKKWVFSHSLFWLSLVVIGATLIFWLLFLYNISPCHCFNFRYNSKLCILLLTPNY